MGAPRRRAARHLMPLQLALAVAAAAAALVRPAAAQECSYAGGGCITTADCCNCAACVWMGRSAAGLLAGCPPARQPSSCAHAAAPLPLAAQTRARA